MSRPQTACIVRKLCLNYFPVSRLIWKMKTVHINVSDKVSQTHNYLPWPAPLHTDEQTKQIVLRITINITMKLIEIQATPALMRSKNMKHHFLENISGYILIQRKVLVISCSRHCATTISSEVLLLLWRRR